MESKTLTPKEEKELARKMALKEKKESSLSFKNKSLFRNEIRNFMLSQGIDIKLFNIEIRFNPNKGLYYTEITLPVEFNEDVKQEVNPVYVLYPAQRDNMFFNGSKQIYSIDGFKLGYYWIRSDHKLNTFVEII